MNLGMSTACFFLKENTEDAVVEISNMGVKYCEVFLSGFSEYDRDFLIKLNNIMRQEGMTCTAVHALGTQFEPQLFSLHQRQREAALDMYKGLMESCNILGAPYYVMHGMLRLKKQFALNYKSVAKTLDYLSTVAADFDICLTLENVHYCMYAEPGFAGGIEKYLQGGLGYTLDIKQAAQAGFDVYLYMEEMANRLKNVHICGVRTVDGIVKTCLPKDGDFDFERFAKALKGAGYNGTVTLEVYPGDYITTEQLSSCYQKMRDIFI